MCKIRAGRTGLPVRVSWSCKECFAGCVNTKHRIYIHLQSFGEYLNAVIKLRGAIMSELISCWNSYSYLKFRLAVASKSLLWKIIQRNLFFWYVISNAMFCVVSWFNNQNSIIKITFEFLFLLLHFTAFTQLFRYIFNGKICTTDFYHFLLHLKVN